MKKLIILTGDLATGKTIYSKILSERYKIEAYNKDTLKEILGDEIGFNNREENLKLSHGAVSVMMHIFKKYSELNHDIILEANFHKKELEEINNFVKENNYDLLLLNFKADEKILYDRFLNRAHNENRHIVHLTCGLDSFDEFKEYLNHSREEVKEFEMTNVDANTFDYQNDEKLFSLIDDFMK